MIGLEEPRVMDSRDEATIHDNPDDSAKDDVQQTSQTEAFQSSEGKYCSIFSTAIHGLISVL